MSVPSLGFPWSCLLSALLAAQAAAPGDLRVEPVGSGIDGLTERASEIAAKRAGADDAPDLTALESDPDAKPWLFLPNLTVHADLRFRLKAMEALEQGDHARAALRFRQAARYADKASQAALAELYWDGQGVDRDRALAYAWMDLAAERGYRFFLAKREAYWAALDARERSRSLVVGEALYAEFGDEVARPRLQARMENATNLLGLYRGKASFRTTHMNSRHGKVLGIRSERYFADVFDDQGYWAWADATWEAVGQGQVEVLPLRAGKAQGRAAATEE